jgi:hypothetical protein
VTAVGARADRRCGDGGSKGARGWKDGCGRFWKVLVVAVRQGAAAAFAAEAFAAAKHVAAEYAAEYAAAEFAAEFAAFSYSQRSSESGSATPSDGEKRHSYGVCDVGRGAHSVNSAIAS